MATPHPDTTIKLNKLDVASKLVIVARQLRIRFDQNVAEIGITRSQWMAIAIVAQSPGLTQRTIAERLDTSEAAAGRLIDRLCTDGLLERRPRNDDRRAYSVYVTPAAQPHLDRFEAIARQSEEDALAGLSDADLGALDQVLTRIYNNLGMTR